MCGRKQGYPRKSGFERSLGSSYKFVAVLLASWRFQGSLARAVRGHYFSSNEFNATTSWALRFWWPGSVSCEQCEDGLSGISEFSDTLSEAGA